MIVPIKTPESEVVEWVLVELQGKIEQLTPEQSIEIGMLLSNDPDGKSLQLTIGYHQLEGKKLTLKKPMAILGKVEASPCGPMECGEEMAAAESRNTAYEVVGVIRHQYLFKTRPRALISKPGAR
ncbi:hypothetical protein CHLRE_06g281750v5 [Chlamydomonas reinhardtii]|uniref:Chromosome transmission fidelity protein 8 n=1 Tax=Chlamydomonas reinhardtii TaxID=3055 RepID=A8J228_CHLRE|nr:uncharacterized protein CHLRE_06g281750v5 [Chlamydomonas reinhardtii]PNW82508.1 hypothetical protein CHLRE_06g281750v5 [Chlamydomonas reinhardtii]|eukprot:XP_001695447.1 predicted protein [Chlamydomonas reinhardtii]